MSDSITAPQATAFKWLLLKFVHHYDQIISTVVQDIKAGKEVLNNFGRLSSSELLRRYGFVEWNLHNPHNIAEISIHELILAARVLRGSRDEQLKAKIQLLLKHKWIPRDGWFKLKKTRLENLNQTLKILLASKNAKPLDIDLRDIYAFLCQYKLEKLKMVNPNQETSQTENQRKAITIRNDEAQAWQLWKDGG